MISFIEWLAVRDTLDFNMLLHEARAGVKEAARPIPNFKIAKRLSVDTSRYQDISIKDIYNHAMEQYKKELAERMREREKGIGNPNQVFANAVRHQLTNYDAVWQAIEENQRVGNISKCKSLQLLVELWKQVKTTTNMILGNMPNSWRLPNEENVTFGRDISDIISNDMKEKINRDQAEMARLNCDQESEQPATPSALIRPNLQKSEVDIAIDDAIEKGSGTLTVTGNKNAVENKLKNIRRRASENRLRVNYDAATGKVLITAIGV